MKSSAQRTAFRRNLFISYLLKGAAGSFVLWVCAIADLNAVAAVAKSADYSKFLHATPAEHANLTGRNKCGACHRQSGPLEPRFPIHSDCTGCHLLQFTQAGGGPENPICTICHDPAQLHSGKAPLKTFPPLRSFTAEFDHAQHVQGIEPARPAGGCTTCHIPIRRGVAQSLPARLAAHQICYDCHFPGKAASNFSSCGSCHGLGRYSATSTASRAYRVNFSHAEHSGPQRLSCQSCHTVRGRGLPQGRQISLIFPVEHLVSTRAQNCKTCHNGLRAFGDKDTHNCKRCHSRQDFRMVE